MKKMGKILTAVMTAAITVCAATAMVACGDSGRKIEGTYTNDYDNAYVTTHPVIGSMYHTIGQSTAVNKVEFKTDGTYTYTKQLKSTPFMLDVTFVYTGKYSDGTTETSYILNKPTACEWSITPGMTAVQGWGDGVAHPEDYMTAGSIKYTGGLNDSVYFAVDDDTKPIDYFLSETISFNDTTGLTDDKIFVEIKLNEEADANGCMFTYLVDNRVEE